MCDFTLCSVLGSFFSGFTTVASCVQDHSILLMAISVAIGVLIMANIYCSIHLSENSICRRRQLPDYDYGTERGPHTWTCPDTNQSPINIVKEESEVLLMNEKLAWLHYDDIPAKVSIENNGRTVLLRATFSGNTPTLSGGDLMTSYTLVQICFRWSYLNSEGSEHCIDYKKYPLEMQVMHRTGPTTTSTSCYDLLMVGYFFDISNYNPFLDPLILNLHLIESPGSLVEIPPFPFSWLCHPFRNNFFSYAGSLTEPPCYEGSEWLICPEPLAISENQLNEFRKLRGPNQKSRILRNSRPVQTLSDSRVVRFNRYNPTNCSLAPTESCESTATLE